MTELKINGKDVHNITIPPDYTKKKDWVKKHIKKGHMENLDLVCGYSKKVTNKKTITCGA